MKTTYCYRCNNVDPHNCRQDMRRHNNFAVYLVCASLIGIGQGSSDAEPDPQVLVTPRGDPAPFPHFPAVTALPGTNTENCLFAVACMKGLNKDVPMFAPARKSSKMSGTYLLA